MLALSTNCVSQEIETFEERCANLQHHAGSIVGTQEKSSMKRQRSIYMTDFQEAIPIYPPANSPQKPNMHSSQTTVAQTVPYICPPFSQPATCSWERTSPSSAGARTTIFGWPYWGPQFLESTGNRQAFYQVGVGFRSQFWYFALQTGTHQDHFGTIWALPRAVL